MPEESNGNVPEIVLFKSEIEAAAARVAERAMNETWGGAASSFGDVWGGLIGDRPKQWRTRNLVNSLAKTKDHLENKGISIENAKSLPMGELFVIFEGASKTDDIDLSKMWSALLSNGMNPEKDTFIDPSFPRLLGSLSGLDARILHYVQSYEVLLRDYKKEFSDIVSSIKYSNGRENISASQSPADEQRTIMLGRINEKFSESAEKLSAEIIGTYSEGHISYSLSNLLRLGLIQTPNVKLWGQDLIKIEMDVLGERIVANADNLSRELDQIRRTANSGFETDKILPKLTTTHHGYQTNYAPSYELTGYAQRFLEACT